MCAEGAQEVCGRCVGGARKVMVAFYAESACVWKVAGGARKVIMAFYAESACVQKVHGRCTEGDGGILC